MQQARSGTCDKRELGATTRNNASKIHDESQLCSGSKLWSRPPQGNVEKDERKQYRDHSSGTNAFDEPWIKDNAAQDVLFCTRMRTSQALVYIILYIRRLRPCRRPLGLLFAQRLRVHQVPSGTVYVPNMAPGLATFLAADLVPDLVPDLFSFGYQLMYAI